MTAATEQRAAAGEIGEAASKRPGRSTPTISLVTLALASVLLSTWLCSGMSAALPVTALHDWLRFDGISRLFLLLVNLVFLGIATYVWGRVNSEAALQKGIGRYVTCVVVFMAASNLALLSNHLIALWVLLEITTLAAVPLIQHGGSQAGRLASWRYFLFSSVGLTFALLGFACIGRGMQLGSLHEASFSIQPASSALQAVSEPWHRLGLVLVLFGFGTKLGLAPMYSWLPDVYEAAPPATTALLAAVQFNVTLVAVLRVLQVYAAADSAIVTLELVALGLGTMALSALNVIAAKNYKRLIAYAALNHAGVIAVGLAVGKAAAYGVLLYAVSNAFIKAILFLTAGKIRSHYGTERMSEVSGLIKDLPFTGLFFMVGSFALLGLPPFGSFLGELIIMSGLVRVGHMFVFAAFCSILTVTFVATGRAVFPMIWGEPKKKAHWGRQPIATMVPKLTFFVALLAMGLYLPAGVNTLFRQAAAELGVR